VPSDGLPDGVPSEGEVDAVPSDGLPDGVPSLGLADPVPSLGETDGVPSLGLPEGVPSDGELDGLLLGDDPSAASTPHLMHSQSDVPVPLGSDAGNPLE